MRTSGSALLRHVRIGHLEASLWLALELTECQLVSKVGVLALSTRECHCPVSKWTAQTAPATTFWNHRSLSMNSTQGGGQTVSVTIKPLEDRILVKTLEAEQTTASGLVIPDTAKEKPQEGEVLAVGPGRFEDGQRLPLDVQVGDKVIYSKYGGTEVKYDGQEYLILSARDILAVVVK